MAITNGFPFARYLRRNRVVSHLKCVAIIGAVLWFELTMFSTVFERTSSSDNEKDEQIVTLNSVATTSGVSEGVSVPDGPLLDIPPPRKKKTSTDVKKPPPPKYGKSDFANCTLLRPGDKIYSYGPWDMSPIVVERYKLMFFTIPKVGCTVWKQLFRRMEGYEDWLDERHPLPHAPMRNGLQYLYDYPPAVADRMLIDPAWTRAIFIRDPRQRLLSAYLDKGTQNQYMQFHCCPHSERRWADDPELYRRVLRCDKREKHLGPEGSQRSRGSELVGFRDFVRHVVPKCRDPHWDPLADRIDSKYLPIINFAGDMGNMGADAQSLLERIGAWEEYGSTGWPPDGDSPIFAPKITVKHATDSSSKMDQYLNEDNSTTSANDGDSINALVKQLVENDYKVISLLFDKTRAEIAMDKQ